LVFQGRHKILEVLVYKLLARVLLLHFMELSLESVLGLLSEMSTAAENFHSLFRFLSFVMSQPIPYNDNNGFALAL